MNEIVVNEPNRWRLETPGAKWPRSARPDAARKYFMVSADGHANEPANLWVERIERAVQRAPAARHHRQGRREVARQRGPSPRPPARLELEGEDMARNKAGADRRRASPTTIATASTSS